MDYDDSPEEAAFRSELREWLEHHAPVLADEEEYWDRIAEWHQALYQAGFFGLRWPVEAGGRGLPATYELIVDEELARAGAPAKPAEGYLIHALLTHGHPDIQSRFLPGLISGKERWCQGFSEPDAGSDLASLRTSASLDGDVYVVNGHKVWTSHSEGADWCLLLARTDPAVPKHRGISALIVDMHQPGVEQRPLRMINGVSNEFGEVFFEGVRVPADQMVGTAGDGWAVAMTTLSSERDPRSLGFYARYAVAVQALGADIRKRPDSTCRREREAWARAFVHTEMLRVHVLRRTGEEGLPPAMGSVDKLLMTWTEQAVGHAAMTLAGLADGSGQQPWLKTYLYSRSQSVMGGTSEIQKNVIASRVLGL